MHLQRSPALLRRYSAWHPLRLTHEGKLITRSGYRWRGVGENVASGQTTPEEVVEDWVHSPGHCANLMSPDFTEMGAAYGVNLNAEAVVFWAQEFGKPR